jgi:hypothetical protein
MTPDYPKPIAPPPELVRQWLADFYGPATMPGLAPGEMALHLADVAARWGADQELEACIDWISVWHGLEHPELLIELLRAARRPEPSSLKEQALDAHNRMMAGEETQDDWAIVRRALEQLDD